MEDVAKLLGLDKVPRDKWLHYADVRPQIEDGDLFLFQGTVFLSRVIEKYSHGCYSHVAISASWGDRKMILQAELTGGVQAVPLSVAVGSYRGRVDWYKLRSELKTKLDMVRLLEEAKADLGLTYATSELLRVAAKSIFGVSLDLPQDCENPHALFCSQYVARCFRLAGVDLAGATDVGTSPSQIAASKYLEFRGTILHDPSLLGTRTKDAIAASVRM
jgi:hypothetical protein